MLMFLALLSIKVKAKSPLKTGQITVDVCNYLFEMTFVVKVLKGL